MSKQSSMEKVGKVVTQIIHFDNGEEKTFENIDTSSITIGSFTKFRAGNKYVAIAHKRVMWFETIKEENETK